MSAIATQLAPPAPARVACSHCGLPVPPADVAAVASEPSYCCGACRIAADAIRSAGFESYYALRDRYQQELERSRSTGKQFAEFDDTVFVERHVVAVEDGQHTCELYLEGTHCAACVWLVERLPRVVPGLVESRLDLGRSIVRLRWEAAAVPLSAIARALDRFGYAPHPATAADARRSRRKADRAALVRIGVAGACAGNVMLLSAALYSGMFEGMDETTRVAFEILSAIIGTLSVVWPGRVFFKGAIAAMRVRSWHLDMPIALALAAGTVTGIANIIFGLGELYFDSVTMLVFFLLAGRWLQDRGVRSAADAVELLRSLTPVTAHAVRDDGTIEDVASFSLEPGQTVEIHPGETAPVDGIVVEGRSTLDNAILTGEPRPIETSVGDPVAAGAVNLAGTLRVRAEAVGADTRLGTVLQQVERLGAERVPFLGRADRVAGPFVIIMLLLAAVCVAIWAPIDPHEAIKHTTALLIVVCPCALALATPLVTAAAVHKAARTGVLVKSADTFEKLAIPGTVFLDKTGTLTHGEFTIIDHIGDPSILPMAAAIERDSPHPLARPLERYDERHSAADVLHEAGLGVIGTVQGVAVAIGRRAWAEAVGASFSNEQIAFADHAARLGHTPVFIASADGRSSVLAMGDRVRDESACFVETLQGLGWDVTILSGDRQETVAAVAEQLGVRPGRALGGCTPEQKLAAVKSATKRGVAVMVGDGVNDAAALAAATAGLAVHGGTEASLAAADATLIKPGLAPLSALFTGSRRVRSAVVRCLGASLCYNVLAASAALLGLISPLVAAVLMPISSLTVVLLALSAKTITRPQDATP
ncbi:MAG: heavy metal translocating P-type ATPase metal-binding domain-containing protein [Planctomycetota bacterium]